MNYDGNFGPILVPSRPSPYDRRMNDEKLALLGGEPRFTTKQTPYPRFSESAISRVENLLRAGTTVGFNKLCPEIDEAESKIARWQGAEYCLGTSSGHGALQSALAGLEITSGDEVITTPYTWGASIACILHNNAIPIFADVDPDTGLIDPATIEERITPRTKAILAVHLFGQPADMTRICAIAEKHGLSVVEDGSQAHGAIHAGRKVGVYGDAAGFSCMGGKLLATSEAGYMVTNDEETYWKAAMAGQHMGRSPDRGFPPEYLPYADSLVYTYRLNPISAVLLTEQISKIDDEIDARRRNAARFYSGIEGLKLIRAPIYADGDNPSYHMLTLNFPFITAPVTKESYLAALKAEGVNAFSYVPSAIPSWPRMQPDYSGPRAMWTESIKRNGVDYRSVSIPGCKERLSQGIEMSWNYLDYDEGSMDDLATAFEKVEQNISELVAWEHRVAAV